MRPAWRLAINSLEGRRRRTALLALAVALAASLIAGVACASATVTATLSHRLEKTVGAADFRVRRVSNQPFNIAVLDMVRAWDAVKVAAPRATSPLPLRNPSTDKTAVAVGNGIDPATEYLLHEPDLAVGRSVAADGEIVLDESLAESLGAGVGDTLDVQKFGDPLALTVVGVARPQTIGSLSQATRAEAFVTLRTLADITGVEGRITQIDGAFRDPELARSLTRPLGLPRDLIVQFTERMTSGLDRTARNSRFGLLVAAVLTFIAAAFIILTGLTTNLTERKRELAIVRCVGGARAHLASAQLLVGGMIGLFGGLLGAPLGAALAFLLTTIFRDRLPGGFQLSWFGVALALGGSLLAGLIGAVWPAIEASRVSPLRALAARAAKPRTARLVLVGCVGGVLIAFQAALVALTHDGQRLFWLYMTAGLPLMMTGYFLLGPPLVIVIARVCGPLVERVFMLPRSLAAGSLAASPFRNGFTAAALMVGLAMMTALWTEGRAFLRWADSIRFPDAFAHGWLGLDDTARERVHDLPFVENTCAITMLRVDSEFGVRALNPLKTSFIAFEPEPFFEMTRLTWIEGDAQSALRRLEQGGAILVAREFTLAHGYHLGDTYTITHEGSSHDFEIAGVIASPGLDIASKYFDIGREYYAQSIHSVFGTRDDMRRVFGIDAIHLIQIDLDDSVSDETALAAIRAALGNTLLVVGSGREIKQVIAGIGGSSLRVMSFVAIGAMCIACLGVGNIVIAGIDARRFEFGVLRSIGADSGLVPRLVLAEVVLIGITACALGTPLGLQHAWAGMRMNRLLAGLDLSFDPPLLPILLGWAILLALALLAAALPTIALARQKPRDLLGAARG